MPMMDTPGFDEGAAAGARSALADRLSQAQSQIAAQGIAQQSQARKAEIEQTQFTQLTPDNLKGLHPAAAQMALSVGQMQPTGAIRINHQQMQAVTDTHKAYVQHDWQVDAENKLKQGILDNAPKHPVTGLPVVEPELAAMSSQLGTGRVSKEDMTGIMGQLKAQSNFRRIQQLEAGDAGASGQPPRSPEDTQTLQASADARRAAAGPTDALRAAQGRPPSGLADPQQGSPPGLKTSVTRKLGMSGDNLTYNRDIKTDERVHPFDQWTPSGHYLTASAEEKAQARQDAIDFESSKASRVTFGREGAKSQAAWDLPANPKDSANWYIPAGSLLPNGTTTEKGEYAANIPGLAGASQKDFRDIGGVQVNTRGGAQLIAKSEEGVGLAHSHVAAMKQDLVDAYKQGLIPLSEAGWTQAKLQAFKNALQSGLYPALSRMSAHAKGDLAVAMQFAPPGGGVRGGYSFLRYVNSANPLDLDSMKAVSFQGGTAALDAWDELVTAKGKSVGLGQGQLGQSVTPKPYTPAAPPARTTGAGVSGTTWTRDASGKLIKQGQ